MVSLPLHMAISSNAVCGNCRPVACALPKKTPQSAYGLAKIPRSTAYAVLFPRSRFFSNATPPNGGKDDSGTTSSSPTKDTTPNTQPPADDLACYGIGSEVECVVPEYSQEGRPQQQPQTIPSSSGRSSDNTSSVLETLLLISPFFFWGTSMVAMKQLAPHTTTLFVAAWRLLPAGAALLLWAKASGRKGPQSAMGWLAVALFGLVDGACFQGFLAEGLQRTSAGLGSVIIDSQPLSVALLASILFKEKLGPKGFAGLALGVSGLLLLEVPPSSVLTSLPETVAGVTAGLTDGLTNFGSSISASSSGIVGDVSSGIISSGSGAGTAGEWAIWDSGEWWMLLAAQSMAVGTVMVRWVAKYCDPVAATGWHMILGGIPLLGLAVMQEGAQLGDKVSQLTAMDAGLLIYVSLLGSAASYGVFFYEATTRGNLTALSSLTFLTPMFAAAGGFIVLGETLTPLQLVGAGVTLGGVTLINSGGGGSGEGKENEE